MSLRCCCLERLIDPRTKIVIAAHGWIQQRKEFPKKFWVRIENKEPEYFNREDSAKFFYDHSIAPLLVAFQVDTTSHNQSKRRPPIRGHQRA